MYTFRENISRRDFESFVEKSGFAPIQQTAAWAELKNNWKPYFCGIYDGETPKGVALVLVRRLMPGFSYAYCPRGPVMDFGSADAVKAFADGLKAFCRKNGVYALTCDPEIAVGLTLPDMAEEAYFNPYDIEKGKAEFENLVAAGFVHKGFGKELHSALQPRFNAMIPLCDGGGSELDAAKLKKNYCRKMRKYFGVFQAARGLLFEHAEPTDDNLRLFEQMIKQTEQRQNISLRGESYFRLLSQAFAGNASFMFVKTDVTVYIDGLKKRLAKEPENAEKINQQIGEAEKIMAERGKIVPLAALLTVFPPNSEGPRIAEYLYAGSDLTVFSSFCATMCGVNEVCLESIKRGCHFLNLGGFAGTFDDGLYDFKRQFNPLCVEYAGEFDLVINAAKNSLMTKYLPQLKKLYKKLKGGKLNKTSKNGQ